MRANDGRMSGENTQIHTIHLVAEITTQMCRCTCMRSANCVLLVWLLLCAVCCVLV